MRGKLTVAVIAVLLAVTLAPATGAQDDGQDGPAGVVVNGNWAQAPAERAEIKELEKVFGRFATPDETYVGGFLAFQNATCDGAPCFTDIAASPAGGPVVASLAMEGSPEFRLRDETGNLSSAAGYVALTRGADGIGVIHADDALTLRFTVAPGATARQVGQGAVAFEKPGSASLLVDAPTGTDVQIADGQAVLTLPAGADGIVSEARFISRGVSFTRGECADVGACMLNVTSGKSGAPSLASIRLLGGPATLETRSATAELSNDAGSFLLAAAPPGVGVFRTQNGLTASLTLAEGASAEVLGGGLVALENEEATIILDAGDASGLQIRDREVRLALPAGGTAHLFGSLEKGLGAIPADNLTAFLRADRLGGFVTGSNVQGNPFVTAIDLEGRVGNVTAENGRFSIAVDPTESNANLFVLRLNTNLTLGNEQATSIALLVDGFLVPTVAAPTDMWNGTVPQPMTAFVSEDAQDFLVAVPPTGTHTITVLQAAGNGADPRFRRGVDVISPSGKPSNVLVGEFNESAPADRLDGRYITLDYTSEGGDAILRDVSYPAKATPLFTSIRIAGGAGTLDVGPNGTAILDGGSANVRFYDAPPAWMLLEAESATNVTFTPAEGATLSAQGGALVASVGEFRVQVVRAPPSVEAAKTQGGLMPTIDGVTGAATVELAAGDRLIMAATPEVGFTPEDLTAILGLARSGTFEGIRAASYDEDAGESFQWVGFSEPPQVLQYEDGVAQFRLQGDSEGGSVAILDLTPAFFRPFDPVAFTVSVDGARVSFAAPVNGDGTAANYYDANLLRNRGPQEGQGILVVSPEALRLVMYLPDAEPHTVTLIQQSAPPVEDPGRTFLISMGVVIVFAAVFAWYVVRKYEA